MGADAANGHTPASCAALLGKVAIIGGGIGGLTAAYHLAGAGARVTLFEASDRLGGLGTFFSYRDRHLSRFYHCMLPSDRHLLALLENLGLQNEVYWKRTSFGFIQGGKLYPLNGPLDLLRFRALPLLDRIRVGLTGLWGSVRSSRGLDAITCKEWLTRLSGDQAFHTFWKPMLQAKFGDRYHDVPALWFWTRFNREKGSGPERKGYIQGGYKRIVDTIARAIEERSGSIHLNAAVDQLDLDDNGRLLLGTAGQESRLFDRVVITAPAFFLAKATAGGRLAAIAETANPGIDLQGVVNAVFMLRRGISGHYWVATVDPEIPFQGVVESTSLLNRDDSAGVHLIYVMKYLHRTDPEFSKPDSEFLEEYQSGLKRLFPDLQDSDVIDRFIFRSPFVEPLYTTGYERLKPPVVLLPGKIYLASTTQVYPEVTSWNGAVGLANRVIDQVLSSQR